MNQLQLYATIWINFTKSWQRNQTRKYILSEFLHKRQKAGPIQTSEVLTIWQQSAQGRPFQMLEKFCSVIWVLGAPMCLHCDVLVCRLILIKICLKIRTKADDVTHLVECLPSVLKCPGFDPQQCIIQALKGRQKTKFKVHNKDANGLLTWKGASSLGLNPRQRTACNRGMLRVREMVFTREESPNWWSNAQWPALRSYAYR